MSEQWTQDIIMQRPARKPWQLQVTYDPKAQAQAEDETPLLKPQAAPSPDTSAPAQYSDSRWPGPGPPLSTTLSPPPPALRSFGFYFIVSVATTSGFDCFPLLCHSGILGSRQKEDEWGGRPGLQEEHTARGRVGMTSDLRALLERTLKEA